MTHVRNLRVDESIPVGLGLEQYPHLDPEYVWLAEQSGQIVGVVVVMTQHGMAFIMHTRGTGTGTKSWLLTLLRAMMRDLKTRGVVGFMTFFQPNISPCEKALARIIRRYGATLFPPLQVAWCAGRIK